MEENIYEMLWDCEYCSSKKLLGLTHRFCPNCGAAQNSEKRYFPPENEKRPAKDHEYFGADRVCPACKAASGAKVKFCRACGRPMEGTAAVNLAGEGQAAQAPPPKPAGKVGLGIAAGLCAAVLGALLFLRTKPVTLTVSGHDWLRELPVETLGFAHENAWCDELPTGARETSRKKEVRSHETVPDGEDCRQVKKDRGDGTYAETRECSPKTREKSIYADKCEFDVKRWQASRVERSQGSSLTPEPSWPAASLAREGDCVGCERLGARKEIYAVLLTEEGRTPRITRILDRDVPVHYRGRGTHRCEFTSPERWAAMPVGSMWRAEKRSLTGGILCDKLSAER